MNKKSEYINFRLSEELKNKLENEAEQNGFESLSSLILFIIRNYLNKTQ